MQADELVLDLSVTPEPDCAVVTRRNEDVAGQLSNEIGISSFTAPLTTYSAYSDSRIEECLDQHLLKIIFLRQDRDCKNAKRNIMFIFNAN